MSYILAAKVNKKWYLAMEDILLEEIHNINDIRTMPKHIKVFSSKNSLYAQKYKDALCKEVNIDEFKIIEVKQKFKTIKDGWEVCGLLTKGR